MDVRRSVETFEFEGEATAAVANDQDREATPAESSLSEGPALTALVPAATKRRLDLLFIVVVLLIELVWLGAFAYLGWILCT